MWTNLARANLSLPSTTGSDETSSTPTNSGNKDPITRRFLAPSRYFHYFLLRRLALDSRIKNKSVFWIE